ncbi:nitric oxide synthase, inducible-like [Myxocyprinus asiaticus]|uniref:nitric oxide synthase, inducible-like n=1 Tax=Myxocyprinus asiaticus TaxID=70543 RepID=UPI002223B011|nr:nitric oxide synthase, inducible-like [Myxocyprinus asiaticus]
MGKQIQATSIVNDKTTVPSKVIDRISRCPVAVHLRNYQNGSTHQDTLYQRAVQNTPCNSKTCEGSIMSPKSLIRGSPKITPGSSDILTQAVDFIDQYYKSFKIPNPTEHQARVDRVTLEITLTGSYTLTADELAFGAKQAWRNAPRCIGRIQWANLQDHKRLEALASDFQEYSTWKDFHRPTFSEVLEEFPSVKVPAAFILSQLPLLKPRLYSVSSSLDKLHLTISVVEYHTQGGQGPRHFGTCSTWFNTIKRGHGVPCFVHRSGGFHLPADPNTPVILIGAGSGIAPFRSFWQQRIHDMKKTGLKFSPMTLVFGCRDSEKDHLYKVETLKLRLDGILSNVSTAYSRQPDKPKMYVQDVLREQLSEKVLEVLHKNTGHLYACDVVCTLQEILASKTGMTITEAGEYPERLKGEKRYHQDIFGA